MLPAPTDPGGTGVLPQVLLVAAVALPLLGALSVLLPAPPGLRGRSPQQAALRHGVTVTGVVLLATVLLAAGFDYGHSASVQAETNLDWIPALGIRLHLGVDGISLPLLVLTALLTFLCALYSYFRPPQGPGSYAFVAFLLVLESGTLATFAVLDLLLFFLAFEMVLIPMYFLISRWGQPAGPDPATGNGPESGSEETDADTDGAAPDGADTGAGAADERAQAAWKFILYTLLGSIVMLLGLLLIGGTAGTFDMVALAHDKSAALSHSTQLLAVLAVGAGLAVKTPMWPLHSWLPDAHTAAPTVGSVLLAGVLLKMGTYGFVRILLPIAPDGLHTFAPYLAVFAVAGILYGSFACLNLARTGAGGDLKRLIAYSSVGHLGFVLLGIATMTHSGVNGALFANIAHGLITGLLFFLIGALKERTGSTRLDTLAGSDDTGAALYGRSPRFGGLLAFAAVASLGLPGLAGFWGEMLALLGAYHPAPGLSRATFLSCLVLGALGTLLTAGYLLMVVRRVCMGEPRTAAADSGLPVRDELTSTPEGADGTGAGPQPPAESHPVAAAAPGATATTAAPEPALPDLHRYELAAWAPLVVLTVLAGLWPALLLGVTDPAVQHLLPGVSR